MPPCCGQQRGLLHLPQHSAQRQPRRQAAHWPGLGLRGRPVQRQTRRSRLPDPHRAGRLQPLTPATGRTRQQASPCRPMPWWCLKTRPARSCTGFCPSSKCAIPRQPRLPASADRLQQGESAWPASTASTTWATGRGGGHGLPFWRLVWRLHVHPPGPGRPAAPKPSPPTPAMVGGCSWAPCVLTPSPTAGQPFRSG